MSSIATVVGVSFEYPNGRQIFQNLNLSLENKIYGLVGPNGVGKTTLIKLLSGEFEPTKGTIRRHQDIGFFAQRQDPPSISVQDFLGTEYEWSLLGDQLLEGIDRDFPCPHLSGGQWMRVRLTKELNDRFLILDEPTNDLDRKSRNILLKFIQERPGGALIISHDRECLGLCQEIFELSKKGLTKFGGVWSDYLQAKEQERANLERALDVAEQNRDQARTDRIEQFDRQQKRNRQGAKTGERGGMPKILLGARKRRAQATTGNIDVATLQQTEKTAQQAFQAFNELKSEPVMYADLMGEPIPAQKLVAEAQGFNILFQDWLYSQDLDFTWRGNIRLALKGPNGSGKSTLLKAVLGSQFESRGQLRSGQLKTLSIDQRCSGLSDSLSVFENVRQVASGTESDLRNGLAKFLFTKDAAFQKVASLSGGERLRAALAQGFLAQDKPEFLILDEPTNNLDLINIEFLENLVRQFRGALIVISHDEVFLKNCGIQQEMILNPNIEQM